MQQRTLQKWHGAGNDFLVEVTDGSDAAWWTTDRVVALCARATGVGADGLILAQVQAAKIEMVLFNADGSRAEMSGNGIRCLVAAVRRKTGLSEEVVVVQTDSGAREVTLYLSGDHGWGEVEMGEVALEPGPPGAVAVARVGNPHVVVMDDANWSNREREDLAAKLSHDVGGANVEFVTVIDDDRLAITVVERGVGWTLACGTGSVAAAAVMCDRGLVGARVAVDNPGGELIVSILGGVARLGGPVQYVADIKWMAL